MFLRLGKDTIMENERNIRTRAFGDLSENFEYKVTKRAKNKNESRIRYLERVLKFATIVEKLEI